MRKIFGPGADEKEGIRPLSLGPYRGAILAAYDDPSFRDCIAPPESLWSRPGARVLLDSRNRVSAVRLALSGGREADIVVKEFFPRGLDRLKSLVLPSKAARAWRGALALRQRGLDTASPVAYLEKRKAGFVERAYFLTEEVGAAQEIRPLFRILPPSEIRPLLSGLAAHLSLCHDRGILHRDLSDGNVLVEKTEDGRFRFFLLDTNRIRLRRRLGRFSRVKNLIRLGVPSEHQNFFLGEYFRRAGWGDSPALRVWYKINKSVLTGYIAMKRRLGLRRIARKLRIQ